MTKLAAIRALVESAPATYGTVTAWADAERIHGLLHAPDKTRQRRVPMHDLKQKLIDSGAYAALRNCRENIGDAWTIQQRQAVTAIADAITGVSDVDPATFTGWLDDLVAVGLLNQARRDALAALASEIVSAAAINGLPGPNEASAADIWEAFGWPGKGTPDKGPLNTYRDPLGNVLSVAP